MPFMHCEDAATRRRRAEIQGFTGLTDRTLQELDPWLRLSPAICMIWAAVATALGSVVLLLALVPFAIAGALATRHPFDAIYEIGIRPRLGTASIPRYGAPRRFACAVGTVWLLATAEAFHAGARVLGYSLGAALVAAAAVPTFTGFCIPSWIYGKVARLSRATTSSPRPV